MKTLFVSSVVSLVLSIIPAAPVSAQTPYGPPVTLAQARTVVAAAEAVAAENAWNVVIAVVDSGGHLVLLQRMDNTQFGSVEVARQKAWSAVAFRRPTKAFQDVLAGGGDGLRILEIEGAQALEGGVPLVVDGKIVGAIGVSGVTGEQDGQIAAAGAAAAE
jgi:uncharacterized protein GlcG (DUF336 family)